MTSIRTISYAPGSLRSSISDSPAHPRVEWTLCRNLDVFPILDSPMLERWTSQGRVRSADYLTLFGGLLLVRAMLVAILSWWTASHHPAYRLSTAGQHDIDGRGNDRRMQVRVRTA